ncbi:hypothetical protein AB0H03_03775 [Streptomyces sparsogenes]
MKAILKTAATLLASAMVILVAAICIPSAPPRTIQAAIVNSSII